MIVFEIISYLITIGIFVLPIYLIVKKKKQKEGTIGEVKIPKEVVKKDKVYNRIEMTHIAGIDNIQKSQDCKISLYADRIKIYFNKNMEFNVKNENIKGMSIILAKDLLEKKKSPVLRGLVGDVVAGPGGLILGGMSGLKDGKKSVYALIINYISKDNEEKSLVFAPKYNKVLTENFIKKFEKINNRSMKINVEL